MAHGWDAEAATPFVQLRVNASGVGIVSLPAVLAQMLVGDSGDPYLDRWTVVAGPGFGPQVWRVPRLSDFYGIVVYMCFVDHNPLTSMRSTPSTKR